ncbi:peptidylprolyl isomerase [Marinomonas sp. SBI22]|uniref:peptidylprolyl isomerase n=1 Tax=unclassified Marinomonas TaxID=196814 RepID=UPI0007AFDF17|nr:MULTISPECIES: peptidylprolyl isomerase [unclassified Marinomonas]KZM40909.1 peptidylprolyl isomerase [Marinomonas sp. SBI22]KZM42749.1 peptidylprolyl isomerase [Marinomonas sp. SBI8L]
MNKLVTLICTSLVMASSFSFAATKIDGISAIVDSKAILESDISTRFNIIKDRVPNGQMTDNIRRQILSQMINETLQANYANRLGIRISDQEVNQAILNVAAKMKLDLNGLKRSLAQQDIDYTIYRNQIKNEILLGKVKSQVIRQRIIISEQEINDFLNSDEALSNNKDQVHLRHILVRDKAESTSLEQVMLIKNKIQTEQDFADQAISHSSGQAALEGGNLGWRPMNQLPLLFIKSLNSGKGPLYGPIESSAGQHLLWLIDKKSSQTALQQQTKARHILLSANAIRNQKQTQEALEAIYQRILKGEDFASLAKEFSEDKGSALKGGDLDWTVQGTMVPEFEAVMNETSVGGVSKPFKSQYGWHVLKVEGRRSQDISDKIKEANAKQALIAQKQDLVLSQWLDELKSKAFIDIKTDS